MKNPKLTGLICGGVLSLATTAVFAQQTAPGNPSTGSPSASSQQGTTTLPEGNSQGADSGTLGSNPAAPGAAASQGLRSEQNVRVSQLLNNSVRSQEGKTLGFVRDLILDPQSGNIQFAILSLSTTGAATDTPTSSRETVPTSRSSATATQNVAAGLGMNGKLVPVPWQLLNPGNSAQLGARLSGLGSPNLVLNIEESKLRTAPSFDSSNWSDMQGGAIDQRVYSHFGVGQTTATGIPGSSVSGQGTSGTSYPNAPGSTLRDSSVNPQGGTGNPRTDGSRNATDSPGRSGTSPQP